MYATRQRSLAPRRTALVVAAILVAAVVAFAISQLDWSRVGHTLLTAQPGWIALSLVLMMLAMVARAVSWHQTLRAALPEVPVPMP
ncbi:MAG: flippase-like domain-containing protein, partial [Solirubrobacterales bacterium]|nr:flippase-like domain-containing protein [Solirubrobacterales bacterium]